MSRVDELVARFNGAIKYTPMLKDHPDWTDEECIRFAVRNHTTAIQRIKVALAREAEGFGPWDQIVPRWNNGIPYCRNIATPEMIAEAKR